MSERLTHRDRGAVAHLRPCRHRRRRAAECPGRAHRAACALRRAGRERAWRPRKADAVRDQLGDAGFTDIAVFAGTPPALDAESRARRRGLIDARAARRGRTEEGRPARRNGGAVFHRRAPPAASAARRRRRDPDAASRAAAARATRSSRTGCSKSSPAFLEDVLARAAARAGRSRLARRDAPPADRARFPPPLRLLHVRRRLSRQSAATRCRS